MIILVSHPIIVNVWLSLTARLTGLRTSARLLLIPQDGFGGATAPPRALAAGGRLCRGDRPEAGVEHASDGSGELRIFLPKIGLSVRFKILSIWIAAPR